MRITESCRGDEVYLGVLLSVFSLDTDLGVAMLDLSLDWGVLRLAALPGVWLCVLETLNSMSRFAPLYLEVLLQVWQVAI